MYKVQGNFAICLNAFRFTVLIKWVKKTLHPCYTFTVQLHSAEKWRTGFKQPRTEGEEEEECCQEEE